MAVTIRRYADGRVGKVGPQAIRYDAGGRAHPYRVEVGPWTITIQDGRVVQRVRARQIVPVTWVRTPEGWVAR